LDNFSSGGKGDYGEIIQWFWNYISGGIGMAIFVGGTAALVPERRKDLVKLGPSALLAANLACFQTAAVAGLFLSPAASMLYKGM